MRGKLVLGKTDTGIEKARKAPTVAKLMIKKRMGRDRRLNQSPPDSGVSSTCGDWMDEECIYVNPFPCRAVCGLQARDSVTVRTERILPPLCACYLEARNHRT